MPGHFTFYAGIIIIIAMITVSLATPPHSEALPDETLTGWYVRKS